MNATKGVYTIAVEATEDCDYSIEVLNADRSFRELYSNYGSSVYLNATKKQYFMFRSGDEPFFKIFTMLYKRSLGELLLRVMPVKDDQIEVFLKYINGKVSLGKKSGL